MKLRRSKKGFTIVELVIVVGVIGILSAILIPTFVNLTGQAKEKALQLNLRNAYALVAEDLVDGFVGDETGAALKEDANYAQDAIYFAEATTSTKVYQWDVANRVYKSVDAPSDKFFLSNVEEGRYNGYYAFSTVAILAE